MSQQIKAAPKIPSPSRGRVREGDMARHFVSSSGRKRAKALRTNQTEAEQALWKKLRGYRVVRFWNNEVLNNLEGVLMRIGEVCGDAGSPPPGTGVPASPSRGEVSL